MVTRTRLFVTFIRTLCCHNRDGVSLLRGAKYMHLSFVLNGLTKFWIVNLRPSIPRPLIFFSHYSTLLRWRSHFYASLWTDAEVFLASIWRGDEPITQYIVTSCRFPDMLWGWDFISWPPFCSREAAVGVSQGQFIVIKNKLHITGTNPQSLPPKTEDAHQTPWDCPWSSSVCNLQTTSDGFQLQIHLSHSYKFCVYFFRI
jgi:hypothetical protein